LHHHFRKHQNRILDLKINRPKQVWGSNITHIGKRDNSCHLSLTKNAYSKKIMGYYLTDNMNTENNSLKALKMALKQRKNENFPLIHQSDGGFQYCANKYQKELKKNKIVCSMAQNSDTYQNAVVQRNSGILK
jgi:putative transposase